MEEIPKPDPVPPLRVGLAYNLKKGDKTGAYDSEAEYDNIETVHAVRDAIEGGGCIVELFEADSQFPAKLLRKRPDIVFNIAEGTGGRGREAQVPAILDLLGIPYTGSDVTTLCIALDKALAKRLLATYCVLTPKFRVVSKENMELCGGLNFPVIVKPNAEGSSKGITDAAVAADINTLKSLVSNNLSVYGQDMLVEEYIDGREFTVGVIGNGKDTRVFPPMEIIYLDKENPYNIYSYNVKLNYKKLIRYECPAKLISGIETDMVNTALKVYNALSCRDFARIDFRLSKDGIPYFIEINPLPGLAPGYSDFPMIAQSSGVDYTSLVRGVLNCALKRYGLNFCLQQGW